MPRGPARPSGPGRRRAGGSGRRRCRRGRRGGCARACARTRPRWTGCGRPRRPRLRSGMPRWRSPTQDLRETCLSSGTTSTVVGDITVSTDGCGSDVTGTRTAGDDRLHAAVRVNRVQVRDRRDAAGVVHLLGTRVDQVVVEHLHVAGGRATGLVDHRVRSVLEVVALDVHARVAGGGDAVGTAVAVVVVVDVDRVAEAHPRTALIAVVEPVVVIGDPQVT